MRPTDVGFGGKRHRLELAFVTTTEDFFLTEYDGLVRAMWLLTGDSLLERPPR